jgi:cytoskeleton protein RodZ
MEKNNAAKPDVMEQPAGPGRLLHLARMDLRLAPEDVAQILHLSAKQIIALEKDDYQNLPGATYIRGYLRNYAQLLGLSPEKVLDSYNNLAIPSKPIAARISMPSPQLTSANHLVKAATVGMVLIVLGLGYFWWRSDEPSLESVTSLSSQESRVIASDPASHPVAPQRAAGLPPGRDTPSINSSPASTLTGLNSEQASDPARQFTPVKPVSSDNRSAVSGSSPVAAPAEGTKTVTSVTPEIIDRAITRTRRALDIPPGVSRSKLMLRASQESWADIRDARDNKLLYENIPAGRNIVIEGVAPFMIFLGNAEGVQVEFNGQNFDFSRYRRGRIARFTVGEKATVN